MNRLVIGAGTLVVALAVVWAATTGRRSSDDTERLRDPREKHFAKIRQLTAEGANSAEAYFNADATKLIFQSTRGEFKCDQIFIMNIDGSDLRLVSTGKGRTTCPYFFPDGKRILYSSTHLAGPECPPPPDYSKGYIWAIYPSYDIFTANIDGSDLQRLTDTEGYDAEATISTDGKKIVFTSMRDGDLDIYSMDPDGSNVTRLTDELGYDGGAFYSLDGTKIVYRAYHPKTPEEVEEYKALLKEDAVRPFNLEIFVMDADGSNKRQLTNNGAANFAPFFHPSGEKIIFSSNMDDPEGRNFELYMINIDGTGLERITYRPEFDGFPMFSRDGKLLVWGSNRFAQNPRQTNIFIAEWVD
jgi:Tol biopolymer transport system component